MLPFNKPKFDRLFAVTKSLESIYREKWQKEDKRVRLFIKHETLESCHRPGVRKFKLWVEVMDDWGNVIDIVYGQEEDTIPRAYIMTEDEFEDLIFYELEGKLITELIKRFYERIL